MVQLLVGEAQSGERNTAIRACNDWLRLGPGRSLADLLRLYSESDQESPPTSSLGTLKKWSTRYFWRSRADIWDSREDELQNLEYDSAMKSGLALTHERVKSLRKLARFLDKQIYEQGESGKYHNVWLPDVKVVGYGDQAEVVDIERFNAPLIREYRGTLDDIAKETGGRVSRVAGADGGPIKIEAVSIGGIDPETL